MKSVEKARIHSINPLKIEEVILLTIYMRRTSRIKINNIQPKIDAESVLELEEK